MDAVIFCANGCCRSSESTQQTLPPAPAGAHMMRQALVSGWRSFSFKLYFRRVPSFKTVSKTHSSRLSR